MTTRLENIWRTRDLLDNSYPNRPSFHQLLRGEISQEQDLANELNNTGKPWTTAEFTLNYIPGQTSFDINVNDFGKTLFVVRLTGNQFIPALPVPFVELSELNYGTLWGTFSSFYSGFGAYTLPETIEQMAFYRTGVVNQQVKVQIQPAPVESAVYVITYLVGQMSNDDPLTSTIAVPEHATLVQLRNAVSQLPYTQWSEDRKADMERKQELLAAFEYQLARKERIFAEYKSSLVQSNQVFIEDWNAGSW